MKTLLLIIAFTLTSTSAFALSISETTTLSQKESYIAVDNIVKDNNGDINLSYSYQYSARTVPGKKTLIKDAEGKLCFRLNSQYITTLIVQTKYVTVTERQKDGTITTKTIPLTETRTAPMIAIAYYDEDSLKIKAEDIVSTDQVIDSENCVFLN